MKILKDDLCYVDAKDLRLIPENIVFSRRMYGDREYAVIYNQKDIQYLKERIDIVDYNEVSFLSDIQLDDKIRIAYKALSPLAAKVLSASSDSIINFYNDKKFVSQLRFCENIYYSLLEYKNNRDKIDTTIQTQIYGKRYALKKHLS